MSFKRSIIPLHIQYSHIYTWRNSPYLSLPLLVPLCSPFVSPSTYLAPSSCDRNRPPQSQVACKVTPFAPPFTQLSHPFQIPKPQLSSAKQRRPREYSGSCYPEHFQMRFWASYKRNLDLIYLVVEALPIDNRFVKKNFKSL
jgi:hypothetical protein